MDVPLRDPPSGRPRSCRRATANDAAKGKGVYALVHLAEGDVALRDAPCALLRAVDLTAAALEDVDESPPPPYETCETCGAFTGNIASQLEALLRSRAAAASRDAADAPPPRKGSKALPPPPIADLAPQKFKKKLPVSDAQPFVLADATNIYGSRYCGDGRDSSWPCTCTGFLKLRVRATEEWRAFIDVVGGAPRADRRCAMLAAQLAACALAPRDALDVDGVRHLANAQIHELASDELAREGLRALVDAAWPALELTLKRAFGEAGVERRARVCRLRRVHRIARRLRAPCAAPRR